MTIRNFRRSVCIVSALYATLLQFLLDLLAHNKIVIWDQIGNSEKFWMIFALIYSILLMASGWHFYVTGKWATGFTHAILMLGITGLVFGGLASGLVASPGSDNPSGGVLTAINFVFVLAGVLAAICGIAVIRFIFSGYVNK